MRTIQTTVTVDADHKATIQLPEDIAPGEHPITVVIAEAAGPQARKPLVFSAHDFGPWPEGFTVRREEIYDDSGRGA